MKRKSRDQLIAEMRQANFNKSCMIGMRSAYTIDVAIFHDVYGWSREEILEHFRLIREFKESYSNGFESITQIMQDIKDELDIDMMSEELL